MFFHLFEGLASGMYACTVKVLPLTWVGENATIWSQIAAARRVETGGLS